MDYLNFVLGTFTLTLSKQTTKKTANYPFLVDKRLWFVKCSQITKKNIARIAKRCPEDIASVVICVKLFFPKVLRKY